mmetsp:Transcript_35935/g.56344  ORF Transcript_35935/g.56344 Transcript_35935/m.56344 type:complete len:98 (+) Transcript_35935:246-539(+)
MRDPMLPHQSVAPYESWPSAPRNPPTLAITQHFLAKPPHQLLASLPPSLSFLKDQVIVCTPAWINLSSFPQVHQATSLLVALLLVMMIYELKMVDWR